jgi:choline dehydrogenase-like flavoprotein
MVYTRGDRGDFDRWARMGATGWSYADVLPYFKRSETWEGGADAWRGASGPLGTQWAVPRDPVVPAWLAAARMTGWPATEDMNGGATRGFGRAQFTIRNGRRASAANAYLRPAMGRPNLTVKTNTSVLSLTLNGTRAAGVRLLANGIPCDIAASREVILCGGVFGSPQLLMLSGIGPAAHLREVGIRSSICPSGGTFAIICRWCSPGQGATLRRSIVCCGSIAPPSQWRAPFCCVTVRRRRYRWRPSRS